MPKTSVTSKRFSPLDGSMADDPMLFLTRLFVYFLQNLFRTYPEGCGMRWHPDEETTEIVITAEKPTQEAIEKRPHITCVLGSSRWAGVGLDQHVTTRMSDSQRTHMDLIPSTMSYHCAAKEGLVARRIAWNCSFYTNVLRRVLMKSGQLHHVDVKHEISGETPPTALTGPLANHELVAVVTTVPFYWQPKWTITDPATLWRNLRVELTVNKIRSFHVASEFISPRWARGGVWPPEREEAEEAFSQVLSETSLEE